MGASETTEDTVLQWFGKIEEGTSTHDAVAQRLAELNGGSTFDKASAEMFIHDGLGITLYAVPMRYEDHRRWWELRVFENRKHQQDKKQDDDPKDRKVSDTFLLSHAVYTGDGQPLGDELANKLLQSRGSGPDTHILVAICEKVNPPREEMAPEVAAMLNKNVIDLIIWRILMECGLGRVLLDYMSTHATPEEREWAADQLRKAEQLVYVMQPLFDAEELSSRLNITFRDSMTLLSQFLNADEAEDAYKQAVSERAGEEAGV